MPFELLSRHRLVRHLSRQSSRRIFVSGCSLSVVSNVNKKYLQTKAMSITHIGEDDIHVIKLTWLIFGMKPCRCRLIFRSTHSFTPNFGLCRHTSWVRVPNGVRDRRTGLLFVLVSAFSYFFSPATCARFCWSTLNSFVSYRMSQVVG